MAQLTSYSQWKYLCWGILLVLWLGGCTTQPLSEGEESLANNGPFHTVKAGDTLYAVAFQHGENYRNLAVWNNIKPPYVIFPGQRLRLTPPPLGESGDRVRPPVGGGGGNSVGETGEDSELDKEPVRWQWPARGKVLRSYTEQGNGPRGLDIGGKIGSPIYAASDGKVVYSGNGLLGYGQLIIIKHNKTYLSAYAHNKVLLVKEGDFISKGQQIAEMGYGPNQRTLLHFEVRRHGKSVDPEQYLPRRK